jgi:membrane protein
MVTPSILKKTVRRWWSADPLSLGAAISFYALFSLTPLFSFALFIFSTLVPVEILQRGITDASYSYAGPTVGASIQQFIFQAYTFHNQVLLGVIGFIILVIGALGVLGQIRLALNRIWEADRKSSFWVFIKEKTVSLILLLIMGFILVVAISASLLLTLTASALKEHIGFFDEYALIPASYITSFVAGVFVIAFFYRYLPRVKVSREAGWIGSIGTAGLFVVGDYLSRLYFNVHAASPLYGALGTLAVLMLWIYYSAQILFLGAAWTFELDVYLKNRGVGTPVPNDISSSNS